MSAEIVSNEDSFFDFDVNRNLWDICPVCQTRHIVNDKETGESVCADCGLVVYHEIIDPGREWSAYSAEETRIRERVGPPIIGRSGEFMYTNFAVQNDGRGKPLPVTTQRRMRQLRRQNLMSGSLESEARNLVISQNLMKKATEKMRLGDNAYDESFFIYKKALGSGLVKGRSIEGFVSACVLSVVRERNLPRSLEEVAAQSSIDPLMLSKFYRELVRGLSLRMPVDDPTKYIAKISIKLGLSQQVEKLAVEILESARSKGLIQGKRPKAIAAAALYLSAKLNRLGVTQEKVAVSSDVSEVTLRNRIRELKKHKCSFGH